MPECHPERPYQARGMCDPCYQSWYTANKRGKRERKDPSEYAANYRKPPATPARVPECHPERKHAALGLCRACYQKDRADRPRSECHPERPAVAHGKCGACLSRTRYHESPEEHRDRARRIGLAGRARDRALLLAAYGGKCACASCPETNPEFLCLDHVNGDGKTHRSRVGSHTYADLKRRGFPQEGFRLLCWNCNSATRFGRRCPHENE